MPDEFRIYCPCRPHNQFDIREIGHNLIGLKLDLEASGLSEADERAKLSEKQNAARKNSNKLKGF
jgi:hypothetical protein